MISISGNAATVGIFNKADSVKGIPLLAIGHSVYQPVFRALASEQDDAGKSSYLYTRSIGLLTLYMLPIYTGIYWVADSFADTNGSGWLPVIEVKGEV